MEVNLLKKTVQLEIAGRPNTEKVVGISSTGSKTLWEYGYRPDGQESEEVVAFDNSKIIENVTDFYDRTIASDPEMREFYNCHAMVWYALGAITKLHRYESYDGIHYDEQAPHEDLEPGRGYHVNANGLVNHSVLGINRPDFSLSVLGDNNYLAVVDNPTLMKIYDGSSLFRVEPALARTDI